MSVAFSSAPEGENPWDGSRTPAVKNPAVKYSRTRAASPAAVGADIEVPSRGQLAQLLLARFASEAADTVDSPCAATVALRRPSCTGPGLVNDDGVAASTPCPTEPTASTFFALAGVPTASGAGQRPAPFPAATTTSRSGWLHIARSASRAKESYG